MSYDPAKKHTKCTGCFKSLGVGSRMDIYRYLETNGEASVGELVNYLRLKQPTVSYHLKEMKNNGLLLSKKQGKEVHYSVRDICPHYTSACVLSGINFPKEINVKN